MLLILKELLFILYTIGCKINNNKPFIYLPLQLVETWSNILLQINEIKLIK